MEPNETLGEVKSEVFDEEESDLFVDEQSNIVGDIIDVSIDEQLVVPVEGQFENSFEEHSNNFVQDIIEVEEQILVPVEGQSGGSVDEQIVVPVEEEAVGFRDEQIGIPVEDLSGEQTMSTREVYAPPAFIDDASSYPEYKRRLERWSRITKVDKKLQAEVVVYHLENHPSGIQDKIDTALGDTIINKDDGLQKLIEYLDSIYGEDEMTDAWNKYKDFVRFKKEKEQSVTEFIAAFEGKYIKAKESGCEFSDTVLAFNLLEACKLSDTDEKFILTAVDFKTGKVKKDLLAQVKASLRKFQSRESMVPDRKIKLEEIKETLVAEGWTPPSVNKGVPINSPFYKGKKNALGADGKPQKCFRCKSEYHFIDNCDQSEQQVKGSWKKKRNNKDESALIGFLRVQQGDCNSREEVNVEEGELVMVTHDEDELCLLVEEAGNRGVLDTACSKSVAGVEWMNKYADELPDDVIKILKLQPSMKMYQFGGGEKRKSLGSIKLPIVIGDMKIMLVIEVVEAKIPLLIGSNAMEAANVRLDFKKYEAVFFEQTVPMAKVGTGHFCIDLNSENVMTHMNDVVKRDNQVHNVLITVEDITRKDLMKLHHLYGHVPADKLERFLVKAGKSSKDTRKILEEIAKNCDACIKTKKKTPRPKCAIPRVDGPNQIVTIDLKTYDKQSLSRRYLCYFIDMHSRVTIAGFIPDKKPNNIVELLMRLWIPTFGLMQGLHSDIGGEMSNELLEDVASNLGIKLTTTAAYSPHQNGLNERNHAIVDLMMTRMLESDKEMSPETALCWSLNAKNSLENSHGFSPFQLHIGYNPVLPSATRDGPPSMEGVTKSKSFASHLTALHEAREAFIKSESSAVLKKSLKSKVFPRGNDIEEGDWIYYKKNDVTFGTRVWKGPSKVVAINGKKLFIDQGARLGTVNRDDAVRVGEEFWRMDNIMEEVNDVVDMQDAPEITEKNYIDENDDVTPREEDAPVESDDADPMGEDSSVEIDDRPHTGEDTPLKYSHQDIKKNDVIKYKLPNEDYEISQVLLRAGKATGDNRYWWNVKVLETGEMKSVDTERIEDLELIPEIDDEVEEALVVMIPRHLYGQPECIQAKEIELKNWDDFGTYEEVKDVGQFKLNTSWVLVQKDEGIKARLCIRGDQEPNKENIRTDSPTVHKTTVKLFYLLAAKNDWKVRTSDVKAAFLQGKELDRDVFVLPPKERRVPGVIWKMVKRAYGFVDASRGFYLKLEKTLIDLGCVVSKYDPAMYMYYDSSGKLDGLVLTHVDDLLHGCGTDKFEMNILQPLRQMFLFGKEEESSFKYIGLQVNKVKDAIVVNQDGYIDSLANMEFKDLVGMKGEDLLDDEDQQQFREFVGKIGWLANTSRPDLSFDKLLLSTKTGKATVNDYKIAVKLMKKLKCVTTEMKFPNLGDITDWTLQGYGDAGYRSLPDNISSCGGQLVAIVNKKIDLKCVISWRSRKLRRVVSSSTAAEALAANDVLDEVIYVKEVLKELVGDDANKIPVEVFTDSRNLHKAVSNTTLVDNARLRTDLAKLKQSLREGEMKEFVLVKGAAMIADCLTKKGASAEGLLRILKHCQ